MAAHGTQRRVRVWDEDAAAACPGRPLTARLEQLDERTLDLVAGSVETVSIALGSHLAEIARRVGGEAAGEQPEDRIRWALSACAARGLGLEVEVPFAAENAVVLPRTVAWLGNAGVRRVRVVPHPPRARAAVEVDPFACLSEPYLARTKVLTEQAAEGANVQLVWEPKEGRSFALRMPGFCEDAWGRVHVDSEGRVSACALADPGDLELGRLTERSLTDIWGGAAARDLRRAHLTWDYPQPCRGCPRTHDSRLAAAMPFMDRFRRDFAEGASVQEPIEVSCPGRLVRMRVPPVFTFPARAPGIDHWYLALARNGEADALDALLIEPVGAAGGMTSLRVPATTWSMLEPNTGYWWALFGRRGPGAWVGSTTAGCLIRHEPIPRLGGSGLAYAGTRVKPVPGPRLSPRLARAQYDALVRRVAHTVAAAVPRGAVAAVLAKGDDRLLDLGGVAGIHFPRGEDGGYIGHHPRDGVWATEHLDAMRREGVGYVVIPATAFWWYEHYPEFAAYLADRCNLVLEDRDTCVVAALDEEARRS